MSGTDLVYFRNQNRELVVADGGQITVEDGGKVILLGDGSMWDDISTPLTRDKQGQSSKPDYDFTNLGLLFPQNNATEIVYQVLQMRHNKKLRSALKPHVHYVQSAAEQPTFKIDYRYYNNGAAVPGSWTTLSTADASKGVFTYTSGDLLQIAIFPEIPAPADEGSSANLDVKLYRDDNDLTGDCLTKYFDLHYQIDTFGSADEYTK